MWVSDILNSSLNKSKNSIQILPDFLANQIAAGEVVQRPESVVKELLENALDSGADTITVIVRDSGKSLIHIIDNGSGMSSEDLLLSIKRHATSKIVSQKDLEAILTYGFRGEALASISSVSRMDIISNTSEDNSQGLKLSSEPNKQPSVEPKIAEKGTQIIVRNLFYNVPARRKFLRSNITEFRHISDTVIKTALSHPDRRVVFYDDDTLIFDSPSSDLPQTIEDVLGYGFRSSLLQIQPTEESGIKVNGFVSEVNQYRSTRSNQYVFLNKRPIKSKSLSHAVMSAYEPYLNKGQFPAYIIMLEIDPSRVDINIHPQKHEVKFENEKQVYDLLLDTIGITIDQGGYTPRMKAMGDFAVPAKLPHTTMNIEGKNVLVNRDTGEIVRSSGFGSGGSNSSKDYMATPPRSRGDVARWENSHGRSDHPNRQQGIDGRTVADLLYSDVQETTAPGIIDLPGGYIATKSKEGLLIINSRAVAEALLYKKIIGKELSTGQQLIFPTVIDITKYDSDKIDIITKKLEDICIEISRESKSISITSLPQEFTSIDFNMLISKLVQLENISSRNVSEKLAASVNYRPSRDDYQEIIGYALRNRELNLSPSGNRLHKLLTPESIDSWF